MNPFSLVKFFRRPKPAENPQANATLYPEKIVIETIDQIKDSYSVLTNKVTVLQGHADAALIGATLRSHLSMSLILPRPLKDPAKNYAAYLSTAGFKTAKEHYRHARLLSIYQDHEGIKVTPMINGGPTGKDRGFSEPGTEPINLDLNLKDRELGEKIKDAWTKCVCNYP